MPQLAPSDIRSAQPDAQASRPVRQLQLPSTHCCPESQAFEQVPQWVGSLVVSTHVVLAGLLPQATSPPWQEQVPFTHALPAAQLRPQVPQLAASFCRLVHAPEQTDRPAAQSLPASALDAAPVPDALEPLLEQPKRRIPTRAHHLTCPYIIYPRKHGSTGRSHPHGRADLDWHASASIGSRAEFPVRRLAISSHACGLAIERT